MGIKNIICNINKGLEFFNSLPNSDKKEYSPEEVAYIIEKEKNITSQNFLQRINAIRKRAINCPPANNLDFIVFWGYPGAGKSFMVNTIIDNYKKDGRNSHFNIIDKDEHRDIFSNLSNHLKSHVDECEKFSYPAIDYVRQALMLYLKTGHKSIISVGAMGAGSEFCQNAQAALENGYCAHSIYMCVNPNIAYLSNVYRNCVFYKKIIDGEENIYPRLASFDYFNKVKDNVFPMIDNINRFQKKNHTRVRLSVVNRNNQVIYDSKVNDSADVLELIKKEENRFLTEKEIKLISDQISFIKENVEQRTVTNTLPPDYNELKAIKHSFLITKTLLLLQQGKQLDRQQIIPNNHKELESLILSIQQHKEKKHC